MGRLSKMFSPQAIATCPGLVTLKRADDAQKAKMAWIPAGVVAPAWRFAGRKGMKMLKPRLVVQLGGGLPGVRTSARSRRWWEIRDRPGNRRSCKSAISD